MDNLAENSELFEAQAHIWNQIFNYINSMSLKCAVELGIPDIIHSHGKPITIPELNTALSIHPTKAHCLRRIMRLLVHSGIFSLSKTNPEEGGENEGYALTNSSRLLLKDNPFSVTPFLLAMLDPHAITTSHFTSRWFVNDVATPFETAHGMPFFELGGRDSWINNLFNKGMSCDARLVMSGLIGQGKEVFNGLSSLVDVGGGIGSMASCIVEAFPHIECIVLDLPHVVAGINNTPNVKYASGDMFQAIPPTNAILLKWILHDWGDEQCLKILENCKKAIKGQKGGKVIIIDMVIKSEKMESEDIATQLLFDVYMMMLCNGKERNESEWAKLFINAGFRSYKIIPILGLRSVIEVYP